MDFVKSLSMFHVDAKEIPCVTGNGAPTEKTEGAPGALYMDTLTGELYKCRAADLVREVFTWEAQEGSGYKLPIGGEQLGGVKNGGNVTINEDGTMSAPDRLLVVTFTTDENGVNTPSHTYAQIKKWVDDGGSAVLTDGHVWYNLATVSASLATFERVVIAANGGMYIRYLITAMGVMDKIESEIPGSGSDWNASEGEPGYVKNRTHYVERVKEPIVEDISFEKTGSSQVREWLNYSMVEGETKLFVIFDGVEYECPVVFYIDSQMDGDSTFNFGNTNFNKDERFPFGFFGFKGNDFSFFYGENGDHAISIYKYKEVVHALPEKYLPDCVVKTVNGKTPDGNGNVEIPVPDSSQNVELDTTLPQSGKAADAKAVGDKIAEITGISLVEPADDDIPKVFFGGALQQTKVEAVVPFSYRSKTLSVDCYAEIKAQGNSTLGWPKKNQTVKLYADAGCTEKLKINFKGWGKQNKFVIKANWRDLTHVRDIVSVRLEGDCMRTNPEYDELPELLRTSPNLGGIDGFPVVVYAAGVYQGRYMWNIPKDAWMANMDDELDSHCILCSEDYNSSCFRATANINGNDWTDEIHDTVPASIKTRWNEVISFVRNSTDDEFVANLDSHIKVSTLIDRHLMGLLSCDYDGYGKNQLYITYDGQLWYVDRYDKDGTWGNYWTGDNMLPSNYGREQYEDMISGRPGNLLFIRLEQLFWERLQTRWAELRVGPLSIPNIINRFRELYDITPPHVIEEDYASTTANGAFTRIPNKTTCTIQQIQKFVVERHAWLDEYVAGLTPVVPVPCTGIALSTNALTFDGNGTQTLTATVTPDGCTDAITWESDNTGVATVGAGVVTAIANGSATITAKCGEYSASCSVTVSGIENGGGEEDVTPVYSLAEPTTFNGTSDFVDTGVKLYDSEKDWTILMAADFTQCATLMANPLHCVYEERPWPGVCIQFDKYTGDASTSLYNIGGNAGAGAGQSYLAGMPATATKLAIRCTGGKIDKAAYLNAGEATFADSATLAKVTYTAYDGNLILGCYQDTSGKKGRFWQGTISQCDVYFTALSDAKIDEFLS